jgi:hypothetical protein
MMLDAELWQRYRDGWVELNATQALIDSLTTRAAELRGTQRAIANKLAVRQQAAMAAEVAAAQEPEQGDQP